MKKIRKNGPVYITRPIPDEITEKFWSKVGSYQHQDWEVPEDKSLLASIVGEKLTDDFYAITNTKIQNIQLRKLLKEPLRSFDSKRRNAAVKWVVNDWGRIPPQEEGEDIIFQMGDELKSYTDDDVHAFIKKYKIYRIASWSKILAFADSEKYAIFDARVAMSLNAILDEIDEPRKFFMPSSRDTKLNSLFSHIRKQVNVQYEGQKLSYLGYYEYNHFLKNAASKRLAPSVLEAEMQLFANYDIYANSYAARHGRKQPYPTRAVNQLNLPLASLDS